MEVIMVELRVTTAVGDEITLAGETVEAFKSSLRGAVLGAGDDGYDEARRVWNGMIDRRPALIARCTGNADVIAAVKFAREHNLLASIRGGGHNVSGHSVCQGGLVIDLSPLKSVRVDPVRAVARVGGGATLGDVDHETQAFGLAVPTGVMSKTGVAGLTLHGGMGLLMRRHGLTSDNLIAADVVTADGQLLLVDEENHPDLLWALRGGGGNFGVVTSFEFRLHPVGPMVWVGMVLYPLSQAEKVLAFYRDFAAQAPDELQTLALFWSAPEGEPIPEEQRGTPVIVLLGCYCGDMAAGEAAIQPLRDVTAPVADFSGPMPYTVIQSMFDAEYPDGGRYYWKSLYLESLSDEVIQALIAHAGQRPSPITTLDIWTLGGAFSRVPSEATAFAHRHIPYLLGIEANWTEAGDDEANIAWARNVFADMQRFSPGGAYLNFPGFAEEGEALLQASYGDNYRRLQDVKARYDPDNFFRHNLNIRVGL
jgi:FAD/FMN-containing dehydrogenase